MAETVYLKNYMPPVFTAENVNLDFDLYDDQAIVKSQFQCRRQDKGDLCLYGDELELISLSMNDALLKEKDYSWQGSNLLINNCPDAFSLQVVTRIRPQDNSKLSGLYRSNGLFCTQCEAEGFRRITFFPDRPDVLANYTTRITADKKKYPLLLSNGNLIAAGDIENERHWAIWEDPFKKPSYLFALVAGNLVCMQDEFITSSGKAVDLRIYVEPGNEDKCDHAMRSLKKAMRWDEEVYGREYDLSIFMIVAVSDFNMGAMENKGLNIFNAKYILARPDIATDEDFVNIEEVVGHEYFHNWTGNRVTCRDWFQLSLKEGLTVFRDQEFSRDMNSRDVNRIADVKVLRNSQFPEDASAMAHPVRPGSYQEINNFYTATVYNKGAEVIRMQHTLLGVGGFRLGMDLYFQRHDGQAVTIDDFVAAMEDANGVDLSQFKRWYSQAGTPEVKVLTAYRGGCLTLTLSQSCPPTAECAKKKPFHIPIRIALFDAKGNPLPVENEILELREKEQVFQFHGLAEKPTVSLLRDFSAPIKLRWQQSTEELLALLRFETNGYAKWNAAQRLSLACISGYFQQPVSEWKILPALIAAFQEVLEDDSLDFGLRAEILMPPSFEDVAFLLSEVDVDKVEAARDFFRSQLGAALFLPLKAAYQRLWESETHAMNAQAYGQRRLRNSCLWLMMKGLPQEALEICQQQFKQGQTMSDQMASLSLLNNCAQQNIRKQAIADFYQKWSQEDLLVDKWFSLQASCELPGTLEEVKNLLQHPAFNFKQPNKVRAVIGSFCHANPRHFHASDGSGYIFLADMLIKMDKINPQIASRLATPFTRWRQFNRQRQQLINVQLNRLIALDLSPDLQELVSKSLT